MHPKYSFLSACAALLALTFLAFVSLTASAQTDTRDGLYHGGLANLQVVSRYFTPAQAGRIPTLKAILHRVIYETDQANDDEMAIATALVTGHSLKIDGAKGTDATTKMILNLHFTPLAARVNTVQTAAMVKPVAHIINTNYGKIASAGKSVTYTSGVVRKPGGMESGYVDMTKGARKTRIVEIPTAVGDLGVSARAKMIARRMTSVQQRDPAWWSRITSGQAADGQAVVSLPSGPVPYILTADANFAKEWNTSPTTLAQRLVTKIRSAIETSTAKGVLATPEEEAVLDKQAGDEAYAKGDKAAAEQHYKQAIKDSPSYLIAYKLLIGVYKEQNKADQIKALITDAQGEPSLTDAQIKEIQQAAE